MRGVIFNTLEGSDGALKRGSHIEYSIVRDFFLKKFGGQRSSSYQENLGQKLLFRGTSVEFCYSTQNSLSLGGLPIGMFAPQEVESVYMGTYYSQPFKRKDQQLFSGQHLFDFDPLGLPNGGGRDFFKIGGCGLIDF